MHLADWAFQPLCCGVVRWRTKSEERKMLQAFVRAVWTICKKDLRVWLRQPANVAITVLPALALLFVDALSAGAVGRSPVALVTLDHGARGQQMAQVIHQADLFRVSDATP